MELYHLHMIGYHDNMYKPGKEFVINSKVFNNRLYTRTYESNTNVSRDRYPAVFAVIDNINRFDGFMDLGNEASLGDILPIINMAGSTRDKINALKDCERMLYQAEFAKRELALEDYRRDHAIDKPSRLHSLFACSEEGLNYWYSIFKEGPIDVYRIDVIDEPFQTNEQLLPTTIMSYKESYDASKRYFNPREKDLNGMTDEYLVQGRVKVLEKVLEKK